MKEEHDGIWELLMKDDADFYDEFLVNLNDEELDRFLENNPDFLKDE